MTDEDLRSLVEDLHVRIGELEDELQKEREEKRELENRVEKLENELDPDGFLKSMLFDLEELVTGEMGTEAAGRFFDADDNADDLLDYVEGVEDRVHDIERGEVDPGEVVAESGKGPDPEDLLPIHQIYNTVTSVEHHQHDVSARKELAGRVFPHFADYAFSNEGKLVLKSTKVKDILEREVATPELAKRLDVENPNPNTVREVMKWMGEFGDGVLTFDTESGKQNQVVAEREDWVEYTEDVMGRRQQPTGDQDDVGAEVEEEVAQLDEATLAVATDGGGW
jgi:archaellum component FlaC